MCRVEIAMNKSASASLNYISRILMNTKIEMLNISRSIHNEALHKKCSLK